MSTEIKLVENEKLKLFRSENYNYNFDKQSGLFMRWGKTKKEDPIMGLPEICDMEVSEVCHGVNNVPCPFCYKSNVGYKGRNMTIDTFKKVIDNLFFLEEKNEDKTKKKMTTLSQIALGIGDIDGNPDLKDIILHSRERGIIPNITINGDRLTDEWVEFFAKNLGAIAVSIYDKEISYNAIKKLTDAGMKQVNVHYMIHQDNENEVYEILNDIKKDTRLKNLNAIVFLSLKQKGRGETFTRMSQRSFTKLVKYCIREDIRFGFDSCSCNRFLMSIKNQKAYKKMEQMAEPCESGLFSSYINVEGKFFPCSFSENTEGWEDGIDVTGDDFDFLKDVWFSKRVKEWRKTLLKNKRSCPIYDV